MKRDYCRRYMKYIYIYETFEWGCPIKRGQYLQENEPKSQCWQWFTTFRVVSQWVPKTPPTPKHWRLLPLFVTLQNFMVRFYSWRYHILESHAEQWETKLGLSWKLYPHWLAFMMLKGAIFVAKRETVLIILTQMWIFWIATLTDL